MPDSTSLWAQVHLTYFSPTEMMVTFVTGSSEMGGNLTDTCQYVAAGVPTLVQYGTSSGGPYKRATGPAEVYQQIYTFAGFPNINYSSPLIHHVRLTGMLDQPQPASYPPCALGRFV
jgi:hypothetical protein